MHHYAAGLIDGEGYIGIQESGGSFQVRLKIAMTDKGLPALRKMEDQYGGRIYKDREAKGNNREAHCWITTGVKAAEIIRLVQPHLLVKAEPARIALLFQHMLDLADKHPNGRSVWTEAMRDKARYLREQIQRANRKGPDPEPVKYPDARPVAKHRAGAWWMPDDSLFGPEAFEGRFPTSGCMVNGVLFERPTSAHPTNAPGSSCSPTPRATEGSNGGPNQRGSSGDLTLSSAAVRMLPTPTTNLGDNGGSQDPAKRRAGGHSVSLQDVAEHADFGDYAPAIRRWEQVTGHPAPPPTEPTGRGGAHRLSARFAEWMMGLPPGWVTDIQISRTEQLRAIGNGVVPQQAVAALQDMLGAFETETGAVAASLN